MLKHAKELYVFTEKYGGFHHTVLKSTEYYESTDFGEEVIWAASWIYRATNELVYFDKAIHHYIKFSLKERPNEFNFNKKVPGIKVLLAQSKKILTIYKLLELLRFHC